MRATGRPHSGGLCSLGGNDNSLQGRIVPHEPFSRYVSALQIPFLSKPKSLTELNNDAITTGSNRLEGRIRLTVRTTVPGKRGARRAVPRARVVRDRVVRVHLRLRNQCNGLPLRVQNGGSQGRAGGEQRGGGMEPMTDGRHRSEWKGVGRCRMRCAGRRFRNTCQ